MGSAEGLCNSTNKCSLLGSSCLESVYFVKLYPFGCSYIVPEYSFLDARGLGAYEGKKLEFVSEVLH